MRSIDLSRILLRRGTVTKLLLSSEYGHALVTMVEPMSFKCRRAFQRLGFCSKEESHHSRSPALDASFKSIVKAITRKPG